MTASSELSESSKGAALHKPLLPLSFEGEGDTGGEVDKQT